MSGLLDYATEEVTRAGLLAPDSDYDGMLGQAVLELVKVFADQGHSGMSAQLTLMIFGKVAAYKPLMPLTDDPTEWNKVGTGVWQSRRDPSAFSNDGGKTWRVNDS
jgi:hypothetical protein